MSIYYEQTHEPAMVLPYIELGGIIARLEQEDPARVLPLGFANPHSYRGDYADLAFEPVKDITIAEVLAAARSALGATFEGYKGGDYTMTKHSDCWLAEHGSSSDNKIGPLLLELLLTSGRADEADRSWRECGHRADYASAVEHERECPAHGVDRRHAGLGIGCAICDGPCRIDDVPPNAGSAS
ncbi:hypothetical protein OHA21_43655 [Actinoplanes sp. NBC_00393]|uniref:hypothetical protein n=1 Tax=Actinoplanes sp. NBC_00393 TaxID=2975953 RepID=UPI002E24764B